MQNNQSSETVRTVTEEVQSTPMRQNEPTQIDHVESYDENTREVPVRAASQVETVRTHMPDSRNRVSSITRVVFWLLGILEVLLASRLVLKFLDASTSSSFVTLIYDTSKIFVAPFAGIFKAFESGLETSTLVAMLVYAIVGWGIAKLVAIVTNSSTVNKQSV